MEDNHTGIKPIIEAEVCIAGGGPAGSILARRLAQLGHRTLLVDRTARAAHLRAESLAPSIVPILDSVNLGSIVEPAVFLREKRSLLLWGTNKVEEKTFDGAPAMLVDREIFDKQIREAAGHAGVRVIEQASALSPRRLPSGGWMVPLMTGVGPATITARFFVDARGKRRTVLDHGAPPTAALGWAWDVDRQTFAETRIEAGTNEWFWGTPLPDSRYAATIFLDTNRLRGLTPKGREHLYRSLLAATKLFANLPRQKPIGRIWTRDVTSGIHYDLVGRDYIRVGEAAVSIDPLSSQGIKAAIIGAIQASAAVHTMLREDRASPPAIDFYRDRQRNAAHLATDNAAMLYRASGRGAENSFWQPRSRPERSVSPKRPRNPGSGIGGRLGQSLDLRKVTTPVLSGAFIVEAAAIAHPAFDSPIAYVGGHALVPLLDELTGPLPAGEILSLWSRRIPVETARNIISWMCAAGVLVPADPAFLSQTAMPASFNAISSGRSNVP